MNFILPYIGVILGSITPYVFKGEFNAADAVYLFSAIINFPLGYFMCKYPPK